MNSVLAWQSLRSTVKKPRGCVLHNIATSDHVQDIGLSKLINDFQKGIQQVSILNKGGL